MSLPSVAGCPICGAAMERQGALTVWAHPGDDCPLAMLEIPLAVVPAWNARPVPFRLGVARGWALALDRVQQDFEATCITHTDEVEELSDALYAARKENPEATAPLEVDEDDVFFWTAERGRVCLGGGGFDLALVCTRTGGFEVWEGIGTPDEKCVAGGGYGPASTIEVGGLTVFKRQKDTTDGR